MEMQKYIGSADFFANLYWQQPEYHFVKNDTGEYIAANEQFCKIVGYKRINEIIGTKDYDLKCEAALMAQTFRKQDQVAIKKGNIKILNICKFRNGEHLKLMGTKKPYYNEKNKLIGIISVEVDLSKSAYKKSVITILNDTKKFMQPYNQYGFQFLENMDDMQSKVSAREMECLYYLIRGRTAKEIAKLLTISARTVEIHIVHLKEKLGCYSKSELVAKSIAEGLIFLVPFNLIK